MNEQSMEKELEKQLLLGRAEGVYARQNVFQNKYRPERVKPLPVPPSIEEIVRVARSIDDEETRSLYSFLYLTAARVSEVVPTISKTGEVIRRGVCAEHVKAHPEIEQVSVFLATLKNRLYPQRTVWIGLSDNCPHEQELFRFVKPRIKEYAEKSPTKSIFPFSRFVAFERLNKITFPLDVFDRAGSPKERALRFDPAFKLFPHLLRAARLTHLSSIYGFDPFSLQNFAGWSSLSPSLNYIRLTGADIRKNFMNYKQPEGGVGESALVGSPFEEREGEETNNPA